MSRETCNDDLFARALQAVRSCLDAGQLAEAEQLCRAVLANAPELPEANYLLGCLALVLDRVEDALPFLERACVGEPARADYAQALAEARTQRLPEGREAAAAHLIELHKAGRFDDVERAARRLLARDPAFGFAWSALGSALLERGRGGRTELERAAELLPQDAAVFSNLALACRDGGDMAAARNASERALALAPGVASVRINASAVFHSLGDYEQARTHAEEAVCIQPGNVLAYINLGNALRELGRLQEAEDVYRSALQRAPGNSKLSIALGVALQRAGRLEEAVACFAAARQAPEDALEAQSQLLFLLNYLERPAAEVAVEVRRYADLLRARIAPARDWDVAPDPERALRVGLVSGDLRAHPVGYFSERILHGLKARGFELIAYRTGCVDDAEWGRIRDALAGWRDVPNVPDAVLFEVVRADRIDVLVDMAGHSALGRPELFARKPAPVQVAWLGYFASTGVEAIDYIVCDRQVLPPEDEARYVERPWRMGASYLCFTPPPGASAVGPLPMLENGHPTLGSFHALPKLGDRVLACWAKVMRALPQARLLCRAGQLKDEAQRQALRDRMAAAGIDVERVRLEGPLPREQYLDGYREVDLVLDAFPFPGGTTTAESLWMGVPVITLKGDNWIGRQGASLLSALGRPEWIAEDEDGYVAEVLALCRAPAELARIRAGLRDEMAASALCDAGRYAEEFGNGLRERWRAWCAEQRSAG
ncbi:O-linked N-acetylglucosamine transferase, SPINDLY family protein [Pseudothauera rhizosphaerae]|uniref:protein O-GlcNAc transferase n=1 Tax=Pseudothauera rhizosphaerae TaxID=2565932 RepID=A0A4S4AW92_9RHOO|nr:tetratricopeptide repeat protein [Pseudothauera rhizosphaerae]THF64147.1 tetratricopeptide repeat protein [Pseudothauera rhizosphaerae]